MTPNGPKLPQMAQKGRPDLRTFSAIFFYWKSGSEIFSLLEWMHVLSINHWPLWMQSQHTLFPPFVVFVHEPSSCSPHSTTDINQQAQICPYGSREINWWIVQSSKDSLSLFLKRARLQSHWINSVSSPNCGAFINLPTIYQFSFYLLPVLYTLIYEAFESVQLWMKYWSFP